MPRPAITVNEDYDQAVIPACIGWSDLDSDIKVPQTTHLVAGWGRTNNDRQVFAELYFLTSILMCIFEFKIIFFIIRHMFVHNIGYISVVVGYQEATNKNTILLVYPFF